MVRTAEGLRLPSFEMLDFDEFHLRDLPQRLAAGNGELAAGMDAKCRSFAWRLRDGRAYTYRLEAGNVAICAGDDADLVVELEQQDWSDYVWELRTWVGLLYTDAATMVRGDFGLFEDFEPVLLAMYHGRPLYQGWEPTVDLSRSFQLGDDPEEMRRFFREAGFVHVREVFSPDEVAVLRAEVERLRAEATPDDHRSWWATNAAGEEVCCRVTFMQERSTAMDKLNDDPRLAAIAHLFDEELVPLLDREDGVSVVLKLPDIVEGLADLPWHRDCGTGGHPILCPAVNIGIQLDEANEANGQIHFLGGSADSSNRARQVREGWPTVAINAQPGDVTAHLGHILHAAPPPTAAPAAGGRRTVYVGYKKPELADFIGPGMSYNDMLFRDGGRIRSPEEVQAANI